MRKLKGLLVCLALITSLVLYYSDFHIGQTFGQEAGIVTRYIDGPLPLTAPEADLWNEITPFEATLGPQLVAFPWVYPEPSIRSVSVQALHNASWISFRVEWEDSSEDTVMYTDTFRDAVSIMLSLQPGAGLCMGTPSADAMIAHWKADWQRDVEEAFIDIADLYPNFWSDWYVAAVGEPPYDLPSVYEANARAFVGGWAAGNPLSNPLKISPVETLIAEGFGTLSTYSFQSFIGRGVYGNGKWSVVMSRPLITSQTDPEWMSDEPLEITFAVWDGSKGEVGPKKGISPLLPLTLERPTTVDRVTTKTTTVDRVTTKTVTVEIPQPLAVWQYGALAGILVLGTSILILAIVMKRRAGKGV